MQENTESAIKNGQSSKTGNIGYTRRRKTKQIHNTICVGHHYAQKKTNYVNKTCVLQTTGVKDEPNIVFFAEIVTDIPTLNSQVSLQTALYCWMCIMLYESSFQIIIHSSTKLRRDMVMLPSVRPSVLPSFLPSFLLSVRPSVTSLWTLDNQHVSMDFDRR